MEDVIYVVGHKNPDTDSICSAIALSGLLNSLGLKSKPARQGEPNSETKFVLEKFEVDLPELVTEASGKRVFLVDHSEISQTLDNIDKAEIFGIVDHHKIGDITTPNPVYFIALPYGCTSTIVALLYQYFGIEVPERIAGIMLCAILSDTVIFRSVTTTEKDREMAEKLAKIAGINDLESLGIQLFKEKSGITEKSTREIIVSDFKDFDFSGKKVGIGQVELVSLSLIEDRKDEILRELRKMKDEEGYTAIYFMLTDIMKEGTELLVVSDSNEVVEKAFGKKVQNSSIYLEGVMSRKKQVVPPLEKAYS